MLQHFNNCYVYILQGLIMDSKPTCHSCHTTTSENSAKTRKIQLNDTFKKYPLLSSFSTLFLILLPKCPLCIMAYSSTFLFMLDVEYASMSAFLKYSQPLLISLVIVSVLMNYHGKKTIYAVLIILLSSFFIIYESFTMIEIIDKRFAIAAIFLACWFNGNFSFFINAVKGVLNNVSARLK